MPQHLRPETKDIIRKVEAETSLRVELVPSEPYYPARTRLSSYLRDPATEISISYNPRSRSPDYAIAHEAARFLRFWRAPPDQRYVLVSNEKSRQSAYNKMERELAGVPPDFPQPEPGDARHLL